MIKEGSKNKPCTWCEADALPDTWPPACERHLKEGQDKKASGEAASLKELSVQEARQNARER